MELMLDDFKSPREQPAHTPKPHPTPIGSGGAASTSKIHHISVEHHPSSHGEQPHFIPPDEVAASEDATEHGASTPEIKGSGTSSFGNAGTKRHWWQRLNSLSKKQWIILGCVIILVIGASIAAIIALHKPKVVVKNTPKPKPAVVKPVPPPPVVSTLTGLPISDASLNSKPVTAVMIENSTDARPQSGLDQAGVVFEAVAEGGITRFVALFQDTAPTYIGPVRSVRPYYIQWLMGFDAAVAHVGGSPEALADLRTWGTKNLDQFTNGSYFHRITSRYAPHNVYTSMAELNALEAKLGYGKSTYTPFLRKPDAPSKAPNASSIDFNISGFYYNVHYDYDAATNSYKRSEAGQPHMEVNESGVQTQITPKVVVALVMPQGIEADDLHSSYSTIGSGQAFVFQDGIATPANWHKTSASSNFTFTDANNQPLKFNAGQTWLTALGDASRVSYK